MKNHPLFQTYPLQQPVTISTGAVLTPYHIYDGHGLLIGGTVDYAPVRELLAGETMVPVQTANGRALMAIWVCDFTDASLGPHNELQFSFLVAPQARPPVADDALLLLQLLAADPEVGMLCHGLWNNTATAVAYNRELLALPAALNEGEIQREDGMKRFTFADENGNTLFSGQVREETRPSPAVLWQMIRQFGLRRMVGMARAPFMRADVINPISERLPRNGRAAAFIAADSLILQFPNSRTDQLTFSPDPYRTLDFQPAFLEHFTPFRFVYLHPE